MKKKFKITFIVFLVVVLGCFSQAFAATNQKTKLNRIVEAGKNVKLLSDTTDDGSEIGVKNLDGTTGYDQNCAQLDKQLLKPEVGWKRYDDTNKNISYSSNFQTTKNTATTLYMGTRHDAMGKSNFTFKFVGKQFRIITDTWVYPTKLRTTDYKISIDGQEQQVNYPQTVSSSNTGLTGSVLAFTKTALSNTAHIIEVISDDADTSRAMALDAIDIDATGYLIDPSSLLATGISLNKTTDSLAVGQTDTLKATVTPDSATNKNVIWDQVILQ